MADTRLYELEECVSPQADDILLIEESATQTDKKVKVSSLMPTDAIESAVADWLTAHPEATTTVEDGSITPVKLATSTMDLFDEKADTVGEYDDMTVGNAKQLLSQGYTENKTPYIYRKSAGGDRVYEKLIGGTIAWNQLVRNGNFASTSGWLAQNSTISVTNNILSITSNTTSIGANALRTDLNIDSAHVVFASVEAKGNTSAHLKISFYGSGSVTQSTNSYSLTSSFEQINGIIKTNGTKTNYYLSIDKTTASDQITIDCKNAMCIDLTQMFGTTIADYIYSLEQATAGAGVAWFRQMFPNDYYAYDSGSLQSVNVASKKVYDSNNTLVATYTFDSDLTLRGIPKLDASNNLYYDGDVYESDGTVTRKYGVVDLGTVNWDKYNNSSKTYFRTSAQLPDAKKSDSPSTTHNLICSNYKEDSWSHVIDGNGYDGNICIGWNNKSYIGIYDSRYVDVSVSDFKTAMNGVQLVYELATPTTESADAYINPQIVDADGTEEFVDYAYSQSTRDVAVPVGHESKYMINLRAKIEDATMLPTLPTANGTYTLKCTVASGVPTLSWVAD